MKLLPWITRDKTPSGQKSETIFGLQMQVTWLELKAWLRKWRRK